MRIGGRGSSVAVASAIVTRKSPRDATRTESVWVSGRERAGVGGRERFVRERREDMHGWLWVVVGGCGWLWVVVGECLSYCCKRHGYA